MKKYDTGEGNKVTADGLNTSVMENLDARVDLIKKQVDAMYADVESAPLNVSDSSGIPAADTYTPTGPR